VHAFVERVTLKHAVKGNETLRDGLPDKWQNWTRSDGRISRADRFKSESTPNYLTSAYRLWMNRMKNPSARPGFRVRSVFGRGNALPTELKDHNSLPATVMVAVTPMSSIIMVVTVPSRNVPTPNPVKPEMAVEDPSPSF
jgi:hypothetical protein